MKIFNTLTRKKEDFKPLKYPDVKVYQCGPTVYNYAHIWNLKTSVIEDVITRSLRFLGYRVTTTMNITDIDDKTIRESQAAWENLKDFTKKYTDIFLRDLEKLWVELPENIKAISEIIPEMQRMIQTMLNRGYAYLADDGSIYYSIKKYKKYGNLAHLDTSWMKSSVRIDNDEYEKDNVGDFVLWKAHKESDGENSWDVEFEIQGAKKSIQWRPGWHIECSACAMKYFGPQIDIHMGGEDLIFPHHQNEIAQTEACTGKEFSKYWIHSGHLLVDGKKMAKSSKNFYTLKDIEDKYPGEERLLRAIRMGFMNGRYRDQINFSFEKLEQNITTLKNLDSLCKRLVNYQAEFSGVRPEFRDQMQVFMGDFIAALEDDFALSEAFAVMFDFGKYISSELASASLTSDEQMSAVDMYLSFNEVFGIVDISIFEADFDEISEDILELAEKRDEAKSQKDYALADSLRDEIISAWYSVRDTKEGTVVEKD